MKLRNLSKTQLQSIENGFKVLKETHNSPAGIDIIKTALNGCFDSTFMINIIPITPGEKMFVMSVFPELSTVEKIINAATTNQPNVDTIISLWQKNKLWVIEIDETILNIADEKELTAILLHEIGHIAASNSVPKRIITILQYEVASMNMQRKFLAKSKLFSKLLSLPILNACTGDQVDGSLKDEIEADKFVKNMGYSRYLISIMNKLKRSPNYPGTDLDKEFKDTTKLSLTTLDQLQKREDALAKGTIVRLESGLTSPYIKGVLGTLHSELFFNESGKENFSDIEIGIQENKKSRIMDELVERTITTEAGLFGKKKLEKLEMYDLDYILSKKATIKSESDKLMLVAYIHNKIDTCQYYMDILNDPKMSKKMRVPHSMSYLQQYMKALLKYREDVLNVRVKYKDPDITIGYAPGGVGGGSIYPAGYEG